MKTHIIPRAGWLECLAVAIERAEDNDTIVVESEAAAELGRRVMERTRPALQITFKVRQTDPFPS